MPVCLRRSFPCCPREGNLLISRNAHGHSFRAVIIRARRSVVSGREVEGLAGTDERKGFRPWKVSQSPANSIAERNLESHVRQQLLLTAELASSNKGFFDD